MNIIKSKENEHVKHIKKLKDKKYRDQNNEYVIEGLKLIKEAMEEKVSINMIVVCDGCVSDDNIPQKWLYGIAKYNIIYISEPVFLTLTEVVSPQGILAIVEKKNKNLEIDYKEEIIIALDNVQDPGNLGTILRTIDSVGLKQIILSKGTVDIYNPKVIRSTMGAIFRVNIIEVENLIEKLKEAKKRKYKVVSTSLEANQSIYEMDYNKKVIIIGNEANGVSAGVQKISDELVKIPMLRKNREP